MQDTYLCLDVGGTEIKAAPIDQNGRALQPLRHFLARAEENAAVVLEHLACVIGEIQTGSGRIAGIRLAFPGPFDYQEGVCLMRSLAKYDKLYGVNMRQELAARLRIAPEAIRFANDAAAFALGEMGFGAARNTQRALCVCIGTGFGSAFGVGGALAPPGTPGVPENGYLYNVPFLDGCIDDYISRRGLMRLTLEQLGEPLDGKALAQRVRNGDREAKGCFLDFGCRIRDALLPFLTGFEPEVLCLGGQITRSAACFMPPLQDTCRMLGVRLSVTEDTSLRALQGLTRI